MRRHHGVWLLAATLTAVGEARAFVATAVGGRPGELDVQAQVTAERGKIEPNENPNSFMKARDFYEYKLGAGYTWGHYGPFQFFSTRLEATYYQSPDEKNDPSLYRVEAPGTFPAGTLGPECGAGATVTGDGVCQFHAGDDGTLITASVSFALIHDPKFALGLYFRGSVPVAMDLEKFANPRLDYFSGGTQVGVELLPWLRYESTLFLGSGTWPFGDEQNGAVALNNLFVFHARSWLLPWKAGIKVGPYVEGDIHERLDDRYDLAYSPPSLADPSQRQADRIRAARFAVAFLPYFLVTDRLAVELGYVQKFFGYDARATQAWFGGVRMLFDMGSNGEKAKARAQRPGRRGLPD